jgi:hypothetical protein
MMEVDELWGWFALNLASIINQVFQSLGAFAQALSNVTVQYMPVFEWELKRPDMLWADLEVDAND